MADQNLAAYGVYSDRLSTLNAMDTLRTAGFANEDLDALFPDAGETAAQLPSTSRKSPIRAAAAGSAVGVITGAVFIGVIDAMSLISFGSLTTLLSAGAVGIFGSMGGVLAVRHKGFKGRIEPAARTGNVLLSVRCDDSERTEKARDILIRTGAVDVSTSDRAALDFARKNRILVRAVSDRTAVTPLRLVPHAERKAHHGV